MNRLLHVLLVLLVVAPLTGCFYSREMVHTRREIERASGADFDHGMMVSLGPLSLRTLSWLSGLVPEDEARMASSYLREISRVKVGVYHTEEGFSLEGVDLPRLRRFERGNWEVAVRFRDEESMGWVMYREHRDAVRDLYVVVLTDQELVLARVNGRLNRLLARVMEDHSDLTRMVQTDW